MLLFVGKWCLFILDFFVHSCVVSVLSQSLEKIPSKEGGGGVCIYLQHNVDLMKYFLYYTNYLQFVYGGLGFLSGEFFRCSNLQ